MAKGATEEQLAAIIVIERACSVLSLMGCIFTIVTFCMSSAFHKPINRLVFYASFGNMMTNVGTLMSRSFIGSPVSVGCQLQAFLIQTFMPADAFWTLAMACNVYLTFYHKYDAQRLRSIEIPYLIACYGIPFVPAAAYIFIKNGEGQRVYGNATLWCWVTSEWDILRIATFYAPVWIVIVLTIAIYIRAGRTIYERRKQLGEFHSSDPDPLSMNGDAFNTFKTTEITVISQSASDVPMTIEMDKVERRSSEGGPSSQGKNTTYSVHISADTEHQRHPSESIILPVQASLARSPTKRSTLVSTVLTPRPGYISARRRHQDLNNAAWSYTKCAILFFTAILITWIPSSANRVYSLVHDNEVNIPLQYMSAFVLPLQGFWNAVIYGVTSWTACKNLAQDFRWGRRSSAVTELVRGSGVGAQDDEERGLSRGPSRRLNRFMGHPKDLERLDDSDSVTDVAASRTVSAERLQGS